MFLSTVYIQPVIPTLTVSIDLLAELGQSEAYVGFTGVSGAQSRGLYQQNDILSWELRTGANLTSVPEPSTFGLLGVGLLGLFVWRKQSTLERK